MRNRAGTEQTRTQAGNPPLVGMGVGDSPQRILTVSELTALVRTRLEQAFPDLWLEGEASNVRAPSSGHLYFTLKDHASQIRAVLFRSAAQRLRFELREGLHVLARGRLTVFEPRGDYQLVLEYLEPKGVGALQIRFEQLKEALSREGLFDDARKRPLPVLPRRVGIVTSLSGAALQDLLAIMRRRCPILEICICPVPVQGTTAAPEIAEGIRALGESGDVDVMIVGRGGGSWEDLWCFNEEVVVRAIAASPVPVVSAVGHEIDFTLADFAADVRAPTPSAAAEAVAPVLDDLIRGLVELRGRQARALQGRVTVLKHRVGGVAGRMPLLGARILRHTQRLDELLMRMGQAFRRALSDSRRKVFTHRHALGVSNPMARVRSAQVLVEQILVRAEQYLRSTVSLRREMVRGRVAALDSLSPLGILARGYSIVHRVPDGKVVKDAKEVVVGEEVRARLGVGQLLCQVRKILPDS